MINKHPIQPSKHLLSKWYDKYKQSDNNFGFDQLLTEVAQWGADEELKKCCEIIPGEPCCGTKHQRNMLVRKLKETRRSYLKRLSLTLSVQITEGQLPQVQKLIDQFEHQGKVSYKLQQDNAFYS